MSRTEPRLPSCERIRCSLKKYEMALVFASSGRTGLSFYCAHEMPVRPDIGPYGAPAANGGWGQVQRRSRLCPSRYYRRFCSLGGCHWKDHCPLSERQRSADYHRFLDAIDASKQARLDIHFILESSAIRKIALIYRWLAQPPCYHMYFTRTGWSWFDLVESWIGLLTEKQFKRGVYRNPRELEDAISPYVESTNVHAKAFVWANTIYDILESLVHFCRRSSKSKH